MQTLEERIKKTELYMFLKEKHFHKYVELVDRTKNLISDIWTFRATRYQNKANLQITLHQQAFYYKRGLEWARMYIEKGQQK